MPHFDPSIAGHLYLVSRRRCGSVNGSPLPRELRHDRRVVKLRYFMVGSSHYQATEKQSNDPPDFQPLPLEAGRLIYEESPLEGIERRKTFHATRNLPSHSP